MSTSTATIRPSAWGAEVLGTAWLVLAGCGTAVLAGDKVGFAGVGKPWKVEKALTAAGCQLVDFAPFPDHGAYDEGTLKMLADRAQVYGAGLVTTEKDWIRLPPAWRSRVTPWPVRARFDDEAALVADIKARYEAPLLEIFG